MLKNKQKKKIIDTNSNSSWKRAFILRQKRNYILTTIYCCYDDLD